MDRTIAYCGLACMSCPIHLATLENDASKKVQMRAMIADELSKIYGTSPKPEIISDCDGCKIKGGRLFTGCADCEIRKCAIMKDMVNCAFCIEYACDKLKRHFAFDPAAQVRLEDIRSKKRSPDVR